jgi:DNA-binding response OmpR family regulator
MKKVLLVSSSKSFLERNTNLLMNKGFQFFTANCGTEAFRQHGAHGFDLILCDLELEDMDGCRLCSEVRQGHDPQPVPVILICHDNVECLTKVKQSDASAILLRPVNPTHLLITIGSFIDMQLARNRRVVFSAPVSIKALDHEFVCAARDLSVSGILLEAEKQLAKGSRIICQFFLPNESVIQQEGEVIRSFTSSAGKMRYGVKFIDPPLSCRRAIEKYIATNNHLDVRQQPYRPAERVENTLPVPAT